MMKDGTYEAHELKDGKLVYNYKLDKRFGYFAGKRDSGSYVSKYS